MQIPCSPLTISDHWLDQAKSTPSPNFDDRPDDVAIDLLVIHNISLPPGEFGGGYVDQLFCNTLDCSAHPYFAQLQNLEVSSHLFIARSGAITQYVPFNKRAWHAGASCYEGRSRCNDFSIGIELEGTDDLAYTDEQYQTLVAVTDCLMTTYSTLTREHIAGHSDIAPGRKTDPGPAFDWARYRAQLNQISSNFV